MKMISMMKYRLHRYFYSSRPVFPLIIMLCFLGFMYSMKPVDVCSSYILSGVFQFVLLTLVTLSMSGSEETVEEQLLLLHGNKWRAYCVSREMTLCMISFLYGALLAFVPVFLNCINQFSLYKRTLTFSDVAVGTMIIIGSGLAGAAIGDVLQPRIMSGRKMAVTATVGLLILSIAKDAVIDKYRFLTILGTFLPSVMKPARDLGNGDYFVIKSVIAYLFFMILYYLIVAVIKNLVLIRKKF